MVTCPRSGAKRWKQDLHHPGLSDCTAHAVYQKLANLFHKDRTCNVVGFLDPTVSAITTQFCHCGIKEVLDNM